MKDALGIRMKRYQEVFDNKLAIKTPIIIHIDGKAFHTFTRGLDKPYDQDLIDSMAQTTEKLVNKIQGCRLGYTQSDEISLLLTDWDTFETQQWFSGRIQKISSISASMTTAEFNKIFSKTVFDGDKDDEEKRKLINRTALFDSRCFNLPIHEVRNWFLWRQQDWVRNSLQMFARTRFSHKELHKKDLFEIIKMLEEKDGKFWDTRTEQQKKGTTVYKDKDGDLIKNYSVKFCCDKVLVKNILKEELL